MVLWGNLVLHIAPKKPNWPGPIGSLSIIPCKVFLLITATFHFCFVQEENTFDSLAYFHLSIRFLCLINNVYCLIISFRVLRILFLLQLLFCPLCHQRAERLAPNLANENFADLFKLVMVFGYGQSEHKLSGGLLSPSSPGKWPIRA